MRHQCRDCREWFECGSNPCPSVGFGDSGVLSNCRDCGGNGFGPGYRKELVVKEKKMKGKFYVMVHSPGGGYSTVVNTGPTRPAGYNNHREAKHREVIMKRQNPESNYWVVYIEAAPDAGVDCPYAPFEGRG